MDLTPTLRLNLPAFAFEPWDDEVNDNFDILDAFVGSVVAMNNYAGLWTNSTPYTSGQQVIDTADSSFWVANVSHTSSATPTTFVTERANNPTYWTLTQNSAKQYAEQAADSAQAAADSAQKAQEAYEAIMPDAPRDGLLYGRIDGTWQQAVPIMSPFFQGDPRAPTPPLADNDNSIATTAFVKGLVSASTAFVSIGDLPPATPAVGSLWWDDIGGQLYVYYHDVDTYQWVAVSGATGGQATGFMPIAGGTFTGLITLSGAPTANLHAATKLYVDTKVSSATYPYLLLNGGAQTVVGATTFSSTLTVGGALTANSTLTVAAMIRANNGRIMNYAPNYAPTLTFWRGDVGARGMWSSGNDIRFGVLDGNGTVVTDIGGFTTGNDFMAVGAIWATNRTGSFGLQDFGGNTYGLRFSSDGWRLQWNGNTGALFFYNPSSTALMAVDGGGNMSCNGAFYAPGQIQAGGPMYANTVHFGPQNGWEYQAYVDGAGNQMFFHRGGYYEYWATSGGDTHWIKNSAEVMYITTAGNLWASANITANNAMYATYMQSSGNVYAGGTLTGGAVSVGGDMTSSALYCPNGVFCGSSGDTSFGMYKSGDRIMQFAGNWYWRWQSGDGTLIWYRNGGVYWVMSASGSVNGICYNNVGRTGGIGPYADFSDARLKTDVKEASYSVADIMKLRPVRFMRKQRHEDVPIPQEEVGFIAQDVQKVIPEAVAELDLDGEPTLALASSTITAALVSAFKELSARVVALEARHGA